MITRLFYAHLLLILLLTACTTAPSASPAAPVTDTAAVQTQEPEPTPQPSMTAGPTVVATLEPALDPTHTPAIVPTTNPLPQGAFPGYTLFSPLGSTETYLINNAGEIVHTWRSRYTPGQSAYLLENGHLLRTAFLGKNATFKDGRGNGGRIEEYTWEGELVWWYEYSDDSHLQHHDIEPLPNGNILLIAWEVISSTEAIAAGRDPNLLSDGLLWADSIIEIQPSGSSGGQIVWEWHAWDHLVQELDPTKANYGMVAEHPERIHINYIERGGNPRNAGGVDWMHTNGIDYNAELDQILISVRNFSEIWIIDHSATTAEAAGSQGGRSGKGGDLLYRWGNPQTYAGGDASDQTLFAQHNATWIHNGYPGAGNILVFNNGAGRLDGKYTSIEEIVPPLDPDGSYALTPGKPFGPQKAAWSYTAPNPTDFYADHISGVQRLPNGNTLICDGPAGHFFEINANSEIVWEYTNPFKAGGRSKAGNSVFRAERYGVDYAGIANRLSPGD